jgi:ankyrin repeat protein
MDKLGHTPVTIAAMSGNTIGMSVILEFLLAQPMGQLSTQTVLTCCDETNNFDVLSHAVLADRKEPVLSLLGDYEYCPIQDTRYCSSQRSILHLAAVNGSTNAFEAMLKLCFDEVQILANSPDSLGFMPLAYAAANCTRRHYRDGRIPKCFLHQGTATQPQLNFETLQVPIEALAYGGANVANATELSNDAKSWSTLVCDPQCALHDTCAHAEFANALLETGFVDVNQLHGEVGVSSLFLASLFGHYPVVRVLLENGARQDVGAYSPLQAAAASQHYEILEALLTQNECNRQAFQMERPPFLFGTPRLKDPPLTIAIANYTNLDDVQSILDTIVEDGWPVSSHSNYSSPTTATNASTTSTTPGTVAGLMSALRSTTGLHPTPMPGEALQLAIMTKDIMLVQMLLESNMQPFAYTETYGGMTGMATAVDVDSLPLLKLMLDHSPDIGEGDSYGRNILHHVCEQGKSDALLMVLEELEAHLPDENERKEELRDLIRPSAALPTGKSSPLELAARHESSPCFKILQSYLQESGFSKAELIASALISSQSQSQVQSTSPQGHPLSTLALDDSTSKTSSGSPHVAPSSAGSTKGKKAASKKSAGGRKAASAVTHTMYNTAKVQANSSPSSPGHHHPLHSTSSNMTMDQLRRSVTAKLADFVQNNPVTGKRDGSGEIAFSDIPGIADDTLRQKLGHLLDYIRIHPEPLPYFKVLHSAQQHKRVSSILYELNIVPICLTESLKVNNPIILQQWLRTLALLHRSDTPFLDEPNLALVITLLSNTLFMDTPKAQAYLMVTINNECAAHLKVSPLIVAKLSERDKQQALLRFFDCCIKTVQDDEASPAGIGLLDLFTHVFLKEPSFTDTYRRVIGALANSPSALSSLVSSINNIATKVVDMSAALRMIQRVAQYFPSTVVLAGAVLPLLRICSAHITDANIPIAISAYGAFSDLLKFANAPLQTLLWKIMSQSMFLQVGLTSPIIEARTAACDAIVCLCRDPKHQAELVSDPTFFDLLLKLFASLVPSIKPSLPISDTDALALRECILAMSFLWNKEAARVTAILTVPNALDVLLALYHTEGISAVANRIIQVVWAYDHQQCQALVSSSPLTLRLYQAFVEKSGFNLNSTHLAVLQTVEPFAVPKWHTPQDGVHNEDIEGISCAYCGISEKLRELFDFSSNKNGQKRYCTTECYRADNQ